MRDSLTRPEADRSAAELLAGEFGANAALDADVEAFYAGIARATGSEEPRTDPNADLTDVLLRARIDARLGKASGPVASEDLVLRSRSDATSAGGLRIGGREACVVDRRHVLAGDLLQIASTVLVRSGHDGHVGLAALSANGLARLNATLAVTVDNPIAATTLRYTVAVMAIESSAIPSCHMLSLPGITLVNVDLIERGTRAQIAEALVHEALHEKLCRLRLVRRLLQVDDRPNLPRAALPWCGSVGNRREFNAVRLLSAYHVYGHLAVYGRWLASVDPDAADRVATHWQRARFMDAALRLPAIEAALDRDGIAMRDWLSALTVGPRAWHAGDWAQLVEAYPYGDIEPDAMNTYLVQGGR